MPYALYKTISEEKNICLEIDGMPKLWNGKAVKITTEQLEVAKHLRGVIVFKEVDNTEPKKTKEEKIRIKRIKV